MTKPAPIKVAYHRHTGLPLGIVTQVGPNGYRGTKGVARFVVAKRDAVLRLATAQQITDWRGLD